MLLNAVQQKQKASVQSLSPELEKLRGAMPFLQCRVSKGISYLALPIASLPVALEGKDEDGKDTVAEVTLEGLPPLIQLTLLFRDYMSDQVLNQLLTDNLFEGVETKVSTWSSGNVSFGFFAKLDADNVSDKDMERSNNSTRGGSGRRR